MNRRFNVLLISVILLGAVFGGVVGDRVLATDSTEKQKLEQFTDLVDMIESTYPGDVDSQEAIYGAIRGMLRTLDPHSNFLDPTTYRTMREEQRGHFSGLGIVVTKKEDRLVVISPIEDTPAARLGIRAGDVIAHIEGEATSEMTLDEAVRRLKGPRGTKVSITINRSGVDPFDLTIMRDDIPTKSVSRAFMAQPGIAYLRIKNFTQTTHDEVVEALAQLEQDGMEALILDLRSNPGGLLDQAVKIADLFVDKGQTIVYTQGRLPESNQSFAAKEPEHGGYPLVVLVNRGSASASEIVAGAVQDHDRGLVVGETTWGKGLVQSVYTLRYQAGLALTTAKYFTPSGRSIQREYSGSFEDYYEYDPDAESDQDPDEMAETDAGRVVYGGGGIRPDVIERSPELTEFEQTLERRDVFFKFAVDYAAENEIDESFVADAAVIEKFKAFLADQEVEVDPAEWERDLAYVRQALGERVLAAELSLEAGAKRAVQADVVVLKAIELMPRARELRERARSHIAKSSLPDDVGEEGLAGIRPNDGQPPKRD